MRLAAPATVMVVVVLAVSSATAGEARIELLMVAADRLGEAGSPGLLLLPGGGTLPLQALLGPCRRVHFEAGATAVLDLAKGRCTPYADRRDPLLPAPTGPTSPSPSRRA